MESKIDAHAGSMDSLSSHRHVLVAPIFVVVLLLSSVVAMGGRELNNVRGLLVESVWVQEVRTVGEREAFALERGVKGIVFPHTDLRYNDQSMELSQGSVLLFVPQRFEITVGPWRSIGFGGSFRVFAQGTSVTVVALTSPVLIAGADGWEVLVPVGMQWQSSSPVSHPVRRIPPTFLEEQEKELGQLGTSALLTYAGGERRSLPSSSNEEERVLFSIHPLMREEFWLFQPPSWESQELQKITLLGFPQSDILQRATLPLATLKWVDDVSAFLRESEKPAEFLGGILHLLYPLIVQWEKQGFVERAERYGSAVVTIASSYRDVLSRASKRRLKAIEDFLVHLGVPRMGVEELQEEAQTHASGTSSISLTSLAPRSSVRSEVGPPPFLPTGAVEREVYEVFREVGTLFTVETHIVPINASHAKVEGMVFGGEGGDRTFDFTYNLSTGEVSEIVEGETHYPFAVALPKFLEWVRG